VENLILTVNIVLPIFLLMAVGFFCRRMNLMSEETVSGINKLVFRLFLPCSLCKSLMTVEDGSIVSPGVLLYGFAMVVVIFGIGFVLVPMLEKENRRRGVMIQGIFRSNFAIFGIPLMEALFDGRNSPVAAMMMIATVPLFNTLAVISLESFRGGRANIGKIISGIVRNPLIWGCVIGYLLMQFRVPVPEFATSTISKIASIASPLALFALGGSINLQSIRSNLRSLTISVGGKLLLAPLVVLAGAYLLGFRGEEFAVLMIVFGAPCAVSSYTMAAQMDGDAELAAQQVMLSTILSSLTMFVMIFVFKTIGII